MRTINGRVRPAGEKQSDRRAGEYNSMDLREIEGKNFYQILGIETTAPQERIKEVYRDLARVYHPDSNFYDEIAPTELTQEQIQIFKIITAAYNTLVDRDRRAEYDRVLMPTVNLNLKQWEDREEFWELRPRSGDEARAAGKGYSKASGVFGQATPRPLSDNDRPASIAEIMRQGQQRGIGLGAQIGIALALGLVLAAVIYFCARGG